MDYISRFAMLSSSGSVNKTLPGHRLLLSQIILKSADLSHACRPEILHVKWTDMIFEELFYQGDLEKEAKITVRLTFPVHLLYHAGFCLYTLYCYYIRQPDVVIVPEFVNLMLLSDILLL